jgi:hypothetical protein
MGFEFFKTQVGVVSGGTVVLWWDETKYHTRERVQPV